VRLLHIADVHLEQSFAWLGPDRGRARRALLRATLRRAVELANERKVDALCIAGDLFDRENTGPSVGDFLRDTFAILGDRPVLIAPGNHDYLSPGCLYDQVAWSPNVHIFRTPTPSAVSIGDGTIWGYAFTDSERHTSPLANFPRVSEGLNVALLHAEIVGPSQTSIYAPLDPGEIAAAGLRFAMLGHVHAGRTDEAQRFAYPGSLEPLGVNEAGPRAALLVDVSAQTLRIESIPVAERRVMADEIDLTPFNTAADLEQAVRERQLSWQHADVRLRLAGVLNGELEDSELVRGIFRDLDVTLDLAAEPEVDLAALAKQRTVMGVFVRDLLEQSTAATDDAQKQFWSDVLRVGVAAFRGRPVTL
jgi:DNA repair protein SbcD/Mre11